MTQISATVSGTFVICCVHDRPKRQVTDLAVDLRTHKPHLCTCCENLFTRTDDVPHYCPQCGGHPVHPLGGPIPDPIGEV